MSGERECGVCWQVYDPEVGDSVRQIPPGTAFEDLPDDWRCPNCDATRDRFLPPSPTTDEPSTAAPVDPRVERLLHDYQHIAATSMKDMPLSNQRLQVEVVGFRETPQGLFGGLVTPWTMSAVLFPPPGPRAPGRGHHRALPAGSFLFLPQTLPTAGEVEMVSLFSPCQQFEDHAAAVATVQAAVDLMNTAPQPEPEPDAEAPPADEPGTPRGPTSRRDFLRVFNRDA